MYTFYYDSDPTSPGDVIEICLEHGPIEVLEITTDPGEGYREMHQALVDRGLRFNRAAYVRPMLQDRAPDGASNRRAASSSELMSRSRSRSAMVWKAWARHVEATGELYVACYYCGTVLSLSDLTVDHVVPLSGGGTSTWKNLVPACGACNCDKGSLSLQEFRELRGVIQFVGEAWEYPPTPACLTQRRLPPGTPAMARLGDVWPPTAF